MSDETTCPVCKNAHGAKATIYRVDGSSTIACTACHIYVIDQATAKRLLSNEDALDAEQRAALSHLLRRHRNLPIARRKGAPFLNDDILRELGRQGLRLPTADEQERNLLRLLGNHERMFDAPLTVDDPSIYAEVGALSPAAALKVAERLQKKFQLEFSKGADIRRRGPVELKLTPTGIAEWRAIRRGHRPTNTALIIADLCGEDICERILDVENAVRESRLARLTRHDSADVDGSDSMAAAIEDAALVLIADEGKRPWAGGYAEGLGKPVIYLHDDDEDEERVHVFQHTDANFEHWCSGRHPAFVEGLGDAIRDTLARGDANV